MSTPVATTYDVFLSYPMTEAALADQTARALQEAGLDVFCQDRFELGENYEDALWRAVAESAAVVMIVSSGGPLSSSVAFEVGAFKAWRKPIYVIQADAGRITLPPYLADCPVYPVSHVSDIVESIKRGLSSFSESDRAVLMEVYADLGMSTDELMVNPVAVDALAAKFHAKCRKAVSGERLVRELLTLRKKGQMPRLRSAPR
jgi:hypothetical protein